MIIYIARRIFSLIPALIGISLLAFVIGDLAPGDPAEIVYFQLMGHPPESQEVLEEVRIEMGLADPLPVRYVRWIWDAARGDLGKSWHSGAPVLEELGRRVPINIRLAIGGITISILIALPLGILASIYPNSIVDVVTRIFSMLGAAVPSFWLAYLLILLVSVRLQLLPVAGSATWQHLVLPSISLSLFGAASMSRLLRSSMLEVLGTDYILAARAKGVQERKVYLAHAFRNALIPVVTYLGSLFAFLISGSVIIETIFAIAGVGRLIIDSITFRDFPVIQGFVLFTGTIFLFVNLVVDLSYILIDPRVRFEGKAGQRG